MAEDEKAPAAEPAVADAPKPAPKPAAPEAPDSKLAAIEKGIEAWMTAHVRNSAVSRHTPSYNAIQTSLPALRDLIHKEL